MTELEITEEFIEESKNMSQHRPKTSPHTKSERKSRRDEVFRLHFEYGYSARQISQMMQINRNTINNDVTFCYSKLHDEMDNQSYKDWTNKQLSRFESQRVRLRKELDAEITLQERLLIEKMILDLNSKICHLLIKLETATQETWDTAVKFINDWLEKEGHKDRYMSFGSLYTIPEKSREKILQLLNKKQ
jgi:predicted DNA-binding protein (UPF0251 family)